MKTLKKGTCPGLSGTTSISYELGVQPDQTLWIRLLKSSRGGFVCKHWVALDAIAQTLKAAKAPFASYALHTHYEGKSVNSLSFLMAVLKHEGMVTPDATRPMSFVADGIEDAITALTTKTPKRKPAAKTAPTAPKKKAATA